MKKFLILFLSLFITISFAKSVSQTSALKYIKHHNLVVIKFWAPWCPPCSVLAPEYEEAKKTIGKKAVMLEYNVDRGGVSKFGVELLPTIVVYKNGKEVDRKTAIMSAQEIVDWVLSYK